MQGLNYRISIIQYSVNADDDVGGAIVTGTAVYTNVPARISARRVSQAALEQGLEVPRLFDCIINGQGETIRERDEVEVTSPLDSPYYGQRMRILAVQRDSRLPSKGHTEMTLSRIDRSRSRQ